MPFRPRMGVSFLRLLMTSSPIHNSLLRIDGVTGEPPSLFEQPNEALDFWALELPSPAKDTVESWCSRVTETLSRHTKLLSELRRTGSRFTLFIEPTAAQPVFRLEADFLKVLADFGISLEYYKSDNEDS